VEEEAMAMVTERIISVKEIATIAAKRWAYRSNVLDAP
jgi:hypothetical protein